MILGRFWPEKHTVQLIVELKISDHLCVDNCPGERLSIACIADRALGTTVEGQEAEVEDEKAEADKGDGMARDSSGLCPSVRPCWEDLCYQPLTLQLL